VGAVHPVLEGRTFSTVFIDEAAQATEPASWIPICLAQRVVLAGDPYQLPPTVKSQRARKAGLHISLMERLIGLHVEATSLLKVQYRMHQRIMGFSNQYFYGNQLQAAEEVQNRQLSYEIESPLLFIDTAGCGFEEQQHPAYRSKFNPAEFLIVCEHLYQLLGYYQDHELPTIAILSPYKEQLLHMQKHIAADPILSPLNLVVQTIDGYQGQERDVVYISLVRSNNKSDIGFLSDYRRMNVAMTRARMKLVVVGDSATIGADAFYSAFIDYCDKADSYHTAWMYMR
jgi:superfamily I DNA and/or RNA helicase